MAKQVLSGSVVSALSLADLTRRLVGPAPVARAAIFDLDGTVHRGLCYPLWRGLSVIDLCWFVGVALTFRPRAWLAFARRVVAFRARRRGTSHDSVGEEDIRAFAEQVLAGLDARDVERAAGQVARWPFWYAFDCVQRVSRACDRRAFVSRSLTVVLAAYARRFEAAGGPAFELFGNALAVEQGEVRGLSAGRGVLESADKQRAVAHLLRALPPGGEAVVFANGEEDLAMFDAADAAVGPPQALKIAIKPRSSRLADRADVVVHSWNGLGRLLARSTDEF